MIKDFFTQTAYAAPLKEIPITGTLEGIAGGIISKALIVIGGVAMIFIIWGGVQYIMSQGDPAKVEAAKKTITWAVAGVILIVLSYSLVVILNSIVGKIV